MKHRDNVLLTTAKGRCIRFPVDDVRLFKGRGSSGVRGVRLDEGDEVISMAILRHVDATPGERVAYLKQALAMRRAKGADITEGAPEMDAEERAEAAVELTPERYAELARTSSSCSPCRSAASASALRPTSTASPAAAAKASPP